MGGGRVHLGWGGIGDVRAQTDKAGTIGNGHRPPERAFDRVWVIGDLAHFLDMPPVRPEPGPGVVGYRELRRTVDGYVVVVIDHDQTAKAEVTGQRTGLVADAFHQASVAGNGKREMVDGVGAEAGAQIGLGHGHAHGVGKPLPERAGRHLDAYGVMRFGMPRGLRSDFSELLKVAQLEAEAGQIEH